MRGVKQFWEVWVGSVRVWGVGSGTRVEHHWVGGTGGPL